MAFEADAGEREEGLRNILRSSRDVREEEHPSTPPESQDDSHEGTMEACSIVPKSDTEEEYRRSHELESCVEPTILSSYGESAEQRKCRIDAIVERLEIGYRLPTTTTGTARSGHA